MATGMSHNVPGSQRGVRHPWKTHLRNARLGIHSLTALETGGCFKQWGPKGSPGNEGQNGKANLRMLRFGALL